MKTRAITALLVLAGAAAAANAQGTATYSIAFGSPNGPNSIVLNPGQSTSVFVNVSINPGIGQPTGNPPGAVAGLSDGGFNLVGVGPGSFSGMTLDAPYNFPLGTSAGSASGSGVNGVLWGLGFLLALPHPSPNSPDTVWTGTFTAGATNTNFSFTGMGQTGVFYGGPIPAVALYNSVGTTGQVIVPAPASLALLGLGGLVAARRRR